MEEALKYGHDSARGPLPWKCFVKGRVKDSKRNDVNCEYESLYFGTYAVDKGGERTLVAQVLSMKGFLIEVLPQNVRLGEPIRYVLSNDGKVLEIE